VAEPLKSLLAGGVQGELIALENLPDDIFVEEEQGVGSARYTAERFFVKRPEDYKLAVTFLAAGLGLLHIARLLKVHHMTVAAVREREGSSIDIEKERIRKNLRLAVGIASERLPDIMARLADGQVPISIAILLDKLALLDGEPTQRVEVTVKGHLTHEALAAQIEAFPVDAIEVESTGSPVGESSQKALGGSGVDAAGSDIVSGDPTT
jgi:hypothetical protein